MGRHCRVMMHKNMWIHGAGNVCVQVDAEVQRPTEKNKVSLGSGELVVVGCDGDDHSSMRVAVRLGSVSFVSCQLHNNTQFPPYSNQVKMPVLAKDIHLQTSPMLPSLPCTTPRPMLVLCTPSALKREFQLFLWSRALSLFSPARRCSGMSWPWLRTYFFNSLVQFFLDVYQSICRVPSRPAELDWVLLTSPPTPRPSAIDHLP
jgi:hypothetical protein